MKSLFSQYGNVYRNCKFLEKLISSKVMTTREQINLNLKPKVDDLHLLKSSSKHFQDMHKDCANTVKHIKYQHTTDASVDWND